MLGRHSDARAMLEGLEALAELERAYAENSAWIYTLDVDPMLDALRSESDFRRLQERRRPV